MARDNAVSGKLFIRADAGPETGIGHVMRCLALALAARDLGWDVTFIIRCGSDGVGRRITDEGFGLIGLDRAHPDRADLRTVLSALDGARGPGPVWLVLDGYHFDPEYMRAVRRAGFRLMVLDDCRHLPEYPADVLLNQNETAQDLDYAVFPDTRLLLGAHYALLRPEFAAARRAGRTNPGLARRILVTMGGADPDNVALLVVQALKVSGIPGLEARVVVGPANPHAEALERELARGGEGITLVRQVRDMAEVMAWADMAVSAAGSTCWEACCLGLPLLILVLAENQEAVAGGLSRREAAVCLGRADSVPEEDLARAITAMSGDKSLRGRLSVRARRLVDGQGAGRVAGFLAGDGLNLRPARPKDARQLFDWRNDPEVCRASFSPDPVQWEGHLEWFFEKLADAHCFFYFIEDLLGPVGQIRFDVLGRGPDQSAQLSVSVDRKRRGGGMGTRVIRAGVEMFFREAGAMDILAGVKKDNAASAKAFVKAGFVSLGERAAPGPPGLVFRYAGESGQTGAGAA